MGSRMPAISTIVPFPVSTPEQTSSTFRKPLSSPSDAYLHVKSECLIALRRNHRDFVRLLIAGQIKLPMAADGFINRIRKTGLVKSIEISMKKDFIAGNAFRIKGGL